MSFQPVIKWSGSKRSQCKNIVNYFPNKIDTYYEPFCGGASVLYELMKSNKKVNNYICSDINKDLINLWNDIKNNPHVLLFDYKKMWYELNFNDDLERKKQYYYKIRNRLNIFHSTSDFLFVIRTTQNGLIRYNKKGEFNSSFHITRNGIKPETLEKILYKWNLLLNKNKVEFIHQNYEEILTKENDLLYLDPPYFNTKGMYYGVINYNDLWKWISNQKGDYALSFDGISNKDNTFNIPKNYNEHVYLESGNSSFSRLKNKNVNVQESLYLKIHNKPENTLLNLFK